MTLDQTFSIRKQLHTVRVCSPLYHTSSRMAPHRNLPSNNFSHLHPEQYNCQSQFQHSDRCSIKTKM